MLAKDLWAASEAQEADVAVTKSILFITILSGVFIAGLACTVDNTEETFNATASCEPTDEQITDFDTNVFQQDLQGCVSCHNGSNGPPFLINPADTTEEKKANFCAVYARGQLSPSVVIFNYPQSEEHGPEDSLIQFPASSLQNIKDFVTDVTLESDL